MSDEVNVGTVEANEGGTTQGDVGDKKVGWIFTDSKEIEILNPDAVVKIEIKEPVVKKPVPPKMFIDVNETVTISVDVISEPESGKISFVLPKGDAQKDEHGFFVFTPFDFEFTIPNYEQISTYRQRSSVSINGGCDKNIFRSFLLVHHLKKWQVKNEKGEDIVLDFDSSGELSKEGVSNINRVPVIVWDTVLTLFEREVGIGNIGT